MIEVYTDGASVGNPGMSGAGIYIKSGDQTYEYSIPLGYMSNHEAEFKAVIKALEISKKYFPNEILSFRSDAKVVVDALEKNYTNNETYQPLLEKIKNKAKLFPHFFIKWIPEKTNIHADQLAKKAIQMEKR